MWRRFDTRPWRPRRRALRGGRFPTSWRSPPPMHDIRAIRDDPKMYDHAWASKGLPPQTPAILALDEGLRAAQTALQAAQSRRNEISRLVGRAKAIGDDAVADQLMTDVDATRTAIARNS